MCIPMERVCNGKNDCGNWADEPKELCGVNECSQNLLEEIPGCDQQCIDLPIGYKCACKEGYQLVGNTTCKGQIPRLVPLVPISKIAKLFLLSTFFSFLPFWRKLPATFWLGTHTEFEKNDDFTFGVFILIFVVFFRFYRISRAVRSWLQIYPAFYDSSIKYFNPVLR